MPNTLLDGRDNLNAFCDTPVSLSVNQGQRSQAMAEGFMLAALIVAGDVPVSRHVLRSGFRLPRLNDGSGWLMSECASAMLRYHSLLAGCMDAAPWVSPMDRFAIRLTNFEANWPSTWMVLPISSSGSIRASCLLVSG
jgi:hypothetical protein